LIPWKGKLTKPEKAGDNQNPGLGKGEWQKRWVLRGVAEVAT